MNSSKRALLGAVAIAALALTGCASTGTSDGHVTYRLSGSTTKASSVTFTDGTTSTSQATDVAIPWEKEVAVGDGVVIYQVIAQNGDATGDITCEILLDGKVVKTNTSTGGYSVATCDYQP